MIVINEKIKFQNPLIVTGFHSFGSVGTLAAQYLRDRLNAMEIGFLEVKSIPSAALLVKGEILYPIRIFYDKRGKILIFESEIPLPSECGKEIAEDIAHFAAKVRAKQVVCLEGLAGKDKSEDEEVYVIFNDRSLAKNLKDLKILETGIMFGLSTEIMLKCKSLSIPSICIMAKAHREFPDGKAAANVLKAFGKLYHLKIDLAPLIRESELFERKMLELLRKAEEIGERPEKIYG
ncbi:MAG: PAC2 family protein [Candidatus Nanoarchaeia archaeon]|nr:PAC2 family protein [Candidatus Haiyanarchaeum thermophilum]MCW1303215.1 PAC2 family protein [Candidatus Haiyanarchaeum thermophilum]MCW1304053.1 PAC2 family protein [Candidatus Haiyanarchaeum thermophilum]MCW1306792.1 PAC2 family protein [Candidatus Haiyanarchaeum thermophilum]MCW1307463.1 PAC2 family protein [Candidatus Haiyanarchaeum thermophilum]